MDKTDTFTFINGAPAYLVGKTARRRNNRQNCDGSKVFAKMDKPRDINFSPRGSGVTHGGPKGIGLTQYHRRKFLHVVITYDATPETRLIRNGEIVSRG